MENGIAFAGNLIVDRVKFIESWPKEQTLTTIVDQASSVGGLACTCALDMAKLDPAIPLKVIGIVGNDGLGEYILQEFASHPSIDASMVWKEGETSYTDVMTTPDGRRTFFHFRGSNALLNPGHFDFDKIRAGILHIGYILLLDGLDASAGAGAEKYPTTMCRVLAEARAHGIATSIDVVSEDSERYATLVPPALKYTDYCVINEIEAGRTTGIPLREGNRLLENNLAKCAEALAAAGVGRWVIIHSPELSCGYDVREKKYYQEPSWEIPEGFKVSSVGAGDAFACGILYGAYQGWDIRKSIHTAGAIAAFSLSGSGGSDAIKPIKELLPEMEKICRIR
jgi:sugar/nucleoside kinase (ribokinase family)